MTLKAIPSGLTKGENVDAGDYIKELQGLTVSLLAGAAADTDIALAAIRSEDTIVAALNNNAGTITDIKANMSIRPTVATGTITAVNQTAGDTFTVDQQLYTFVTDVTVVAAGDYTKVKVGADDNAMAVNIAAAINGRESQRLTGNGGVGKVVAVANSAVVTLTATVDGIGSNAAHPDKTGNYVALAETGSAVTISGATLTGGSATGAVQSTSITNQIILFWFNKK